MRWIAVRSIMLAAMGAALPLLSGCHRTEASPAKAVAVRAFTVGELSNGPARDDNRSFSATIHYDREAILSFRIAGRVSSMPVRYGQHLPQGAMVAAIESAPYEALLSRQMADVARLERTAQRYSVLATEGAVATAQAGDTRDMLAAARAGLSGARYDEASTRIAMPFAGVILSRSAEIGETVSAGQAVAVVADTSSQLIAIAQVPFAQAATFASGGKAQVFIGERAQPIAARILRVAGASDTRTGTVAVDLALPRSLAVTSGVPASVRFDMSGSASRTVRNEILIPAEALLDANGERASVYRIDEKGKARRMQIHFVGFTDRDARVTGLRRGMRIITAGAGFVAEGQNVTVSAS